MKIGIPKEIKTLEARVGLVPAACASLVEAGHEVFVEQHAGDLSGYPDQQYIDAGVSMLPDAASIYGTADMIIKVKEPISEEFDLMKKEQVIYTYLHLAVAKELAQVFVDKKITAIAYETIEEEDGSLPLLVPMSEE